MLSANTIMLKRNTVFVLFFFLCGAASYAQNNSPYSRYGLGDVVPNTNVVNRAMGGVAAGDTDFLHVNFTNPASYSNFQVGQDPKTKKVNFGRVILDAGINLENRTLREPNRADKFTSSDLFFSYLFVGLPIRKNWGMVFGLRPLSRVSYKMNTVEHLNANDSLLSENTGSGGTYLPSIGTGFAIKNFSLGVNVGYLFGRKETSVSKGVLNDTVFFYDALYKTETSFHHLYADAGFQYKYNFKYDTANKQHSFLTIGGSGSMKQTLKATRDILQGTFVNDPNGALTDTVFKNTVNGEVIYPASYTIGFMFGRDSRKKASWQAGLDLVHTGWNEYRSFGEKDQVQNTTQIRAGAEFRPKEGSTYATFVSYRAGFYAGQDYITAGGSLPTWGMSFGLGLPIPNYNRLAISQKTIINVSLEYNQRGNNQNVLKENNFRLSLGLNFGDLWFNKRKYD
jgi:hypothetical protein